MLIKGSLMKALLLSIFLISLLFAEDYQLGQGLKINDNLNIGAYFSTDYTKGDEIDRYRLDDVAILAYGNLTPRFSYLIEFEAAPFYTKDFENGTSNWDRQFHYERAYIDYGYSEMFSFRGGKQITPIGYWNLEPINVLRDTSSNPLYSYKMFPKFVTGIDTYGYINEEMSLQYHLFLQVTEDLDSDYININSDLFTGVSLEYEATEELSIGGSLGYYETTEIQKDISFIQANVKYTQYPFLVQTEWAYTDIDNKTFDTNAFQVGGYIQNLYHINIQHAIIGRYEYFKDTQVNLENHIGVFGYSYRPKYAISIKAEYQVNSDSKFSKSIISFSVLF